MKLVACVPLKDTLLAPEKLFPISVTVVPTGPDDGEIDVRVVGDNSVNDCALT